MSLDPVNHLEEYHHFACREFLIEFFVQFDYFCLHYHSATNISILNSFFEHSNLRVKFSIH